MDWNNGFNSSFFLGFPNNPNLDVSEYFGCNFFFMASLIRKSRVDISTHRQEGVNSVLNVKAVVAAFIQEKTLVGAFSMITNLRMELFEALVETMVSQVHDIYQTNPAF